MRYAMHITVGAMLVWVAACESSVSLVTSPELPASADPGESCYGIAGTFVRSFVGADFPNDIFFFEGPVSGDIQGSGLEAATLSEMGDPPGKALFQHPEITWQVTGGSVPALIGRTLVFSGEQVNRPDGPTVSGNMHLTLEAGARRGHLTDDVFFDGATLTVTGEYHGSICP